MRPTTRPLLLDPTTAASSRLRQALLAACLSVMLATAARADTVLANTVLANTVLANTVLPNTGPPSGAEAQADAEAAEVYANTLKWSTASEVDNFGYDVYRGEAEDGPFDRITEDPITGAGTTDEVSEYSYYDDSIDPYKRYFYYVESISMNGERERFTPVFSAKPKLLGEEDAEHSAPGKK